MNQNESDLEKFDKYDALDDLDKRIVQLKLQFPNITNVDIAKKLNIGRSTVQRREQKEVFKMALLSVQRPAIETLMGLRQKAARKYGTLLDSENEYIQFRTAKELLKDIELGDDIPDEDTADDSKVEHKFDKSQMEEIAKILKDAGAL